MLKGTYHIRFIITAFTFDLVQKTKQLLFEDSCWVQSVCYRKTENPLY